MAEQTPADPLVPREPIMKFFTFDHLPERLKAVSAPFLTLAEHVHTLPRNAERSTALRKILEAKDAAVRAALCLALVLGLLSLAAPAFAQDHQPLAPVVAQPAAAPEPTFTKDQVAAIAAMLKAQAAATAQPAAPASTISEAGVLGLGWGSIGSILAALLAGIFAFWKGTTASRVQKALPDLMDAAYWFVERNFGDLPGPQKFNLALGELYKGMTGHGFVLDTKAAANAEATAKTRWQLLAETNKASAPAPVPPAQLAGAQAAAQVATTPGTATDLANAAAK